MPICQDATTVSRNAEAEVRLLGGSLSDEIAILGQYKLQFGIFKARHSNSKVRYINIKPCILLHEYDVLCLYYIHI